MTRGTFYILTDDKHYSSTEFNGDMYGSPKDEQSLQDSGNYKDAVEMLKGVSNLETFKKGVEEFNKSHHDYEEELIFELEDYIQIENSTNVIDLSVDYFGRWFSDYLFFKNLSSEPITFRYKEKGITEENVCEPGQIITFNFGSFIETI